MPDREITSVQRRQVKERLRLFLPIRTARKIDRNVCRSGVNDTMGEMPAWVSE